MKKIIFAVLFIVSVFCHANEKSGVYNRKISSAYSKAIMLEKEEKFSEAADVYSKILNSKDDSINSELAQAGYINAYPPAASIRARQLSCLIRSGAFRSESFKNKCLSALKKDKRKPCDVVHTPYVEIYQALMSYYWDSKQDEEMYKCIFNIFDYDPRTLPYFYDFLCKIVEKPMPTKNDKEILAKIKQAIKNYEKTNPPFNAKLELFKLSILEASGENIFKPATQYLKKYPADENTIKILELLRKAIDYDKPEQIKQYYKLLTYLAVKQPINKDNYKIIGYILKEKKKIEMVAPEVIEN